jgi:predicted extracellular nuclease
MIRISKLALVVALGAVVAAMTASQPLAVSPNIVISQVYGGGGNSGAPYTNDFIELFNRGSTSVSLTGWSLQYASATGTGNFSANPITILSGTLQPGQYYLAQESSGGANGVALPTPDVTGTVNMAAGGAKVALVNTTTGLACNGGSTLCSTEQLAQIVDLVGWGTANFYEGAVGPTTTNTTAALRNANGCTDTDNNASDFTAGTPTPRNTASPVSSCPSGVTLSVNDVSASEGNAGTASFSFTVGLSDPAPAGGVTFDIASADGTATTADNDYVAKSLTGQSIPEGGTSYTFDVTVNGDTNVETDESYFVNVTNVTGATVSDGQGQGTIQNDDSPCGLAYTPIHGIQGSGLSAAITGTVTTEGIVVGDFEGTSSQQGFYLQSPDASFDADPATSEGIFVFTGASSLVSVGDHVRERFNQTTLNGSDSNSAAVPAANIVLCSSGNALPSVTDVGMPFASADSPERYEGMYVRFPQSLVISEYFNYDRFGELVLALPLAGESRPFTGTAIDEPGPPALARTEANLLRRITLDDANSAQNPAVLRHPNGNPFSLANRFRGGDTVQNAVGVLGFDFSLYRIFPTGPAAYTAANPRPPSPQPIGGTLKVAGMNTLNYFLTADYPSGDPLDNKCGPLQNVECRGWDSDQASELTRQRDKLLAALVGLNADIVGLNELENTTGVEPLADIVTGLNTALGAGTYAYINTGTIGTDAIKVGLIYKPAAVTPVGSYQILDSTDDPRFLDTKSRPVLAQTFQEIATGAKFTVAVNHLKSKGSDCNDVGDPDTGDGQGNCNVTRTQAARALVDWLATDPTGSNDPDFLIIGDLNSYAKEDPIDAIKAGADDTAGTSDDFVNLVSQYVGTYAYSYVFDGQSGYLDHALASPSLADQITGTTEWHINADEPDVLDYDTSFKPPAQDALYEANAYRSSDHDPVLVGLGLCETTPPTLTVSLSPSVLQPPNHKYVTVQATITASDNSGVAPIVTFVSATSNEPDNAPGGTDGNTTNDIVRVDFDTFQLRAERDENGTGRIYTITYRATDGCGNTTTRSATVRVPVGS